MRLAERRDNAVLGFLPIRITAAIVRPLRGHRRRQKEAARGSSFPERAPLCPRDYKLASISWMEHPSILLPSPPSCIMGDDALITATSWQRSAFETVFRIENARGRAFVVREAGGRNFRLGIIRAPPPLWRISGWFIACSLDTFFLSFLPSFFTWNEGECSEGGFLLGC